MPRLHFIILTSLSSFVAACVLLQLLLVNLANADENRLRVTVEVMQGAQLDYSHLQQIANLTASLAQQQNDQGLRDVLARQNIQIKAGATNAAPGAPPAAPSLPTSSTH